MSQHPKSRVQAGVREGGQFATEPKSEPEVRLVAASQSLEEVRAEAVARYERLSVSDPDIEQRHASQLRAVAAIVKMRFPQASTFTIEKSDQPDSLQGFVTSVQDKDGRDLSDPNHLIDFGGEEEDSDVDEMLWDAADFDRHEMTGVKRTGSRRGGQALVDVDAVLNADIPNDDITAPERYNERTEAALRGYAATGYEQAAQALLADLVRWGSERGVRVQDLLDRASADVARADGRTVRPSADESLARIERERPCLDSETTDAELAQWARRTVIPALEDAGRL